MLLFYFTLHNIDASKPQICHKANTYYFTWVLAGYHHTMQDQLDRFSLDLECMIIKFDKMEVEHSGAT